MISDILFGNSPDDYSSSQLGFLCDNSALVMMGGVPEPGSIKTLSFERQPTDSYERECGTGSYQANNQV